MRRNIISHTDSLCPVGYNISESATHLFLECGASNSLWTHVRNWLGLFAVFPSEVRDHLHQFSYMAGLPRCTHSFLKCIWFACVWIQWNDRNDCIFNNVNSHPYALFEKVKLHSFFWVKAKHTYFAYCYYDWWIHPLLCMGVHQ